MDNSLVTHLQTYIRHLFRDVAWMYTKPSEMRRDQTRLLHELAKHGSRVLTLDLPALGKHLDKCLAKGLYTPSELRYGATRVGEMIPKLFGDIFLKVFDPSGKLRDAPSIDAIATLRFLLTSVKKLKLECKRRSVYNEVKNFIDIESQIRSPTYSWLDDHQDFTSNTCHFRDLYTNESESDWLPGFEPGLRLDSIRSSLDTLQHVCNRVSAQFGDFHNERISERPKHGPGVVANQTKSESKYRFKYWSNKLQVAFPYDLYATTNFGVGSDHDREVEWGLNHEYPSRLISVPKSQKGPRLIAAEPTEHQWIQQLVWNQLEARCKETPLVHCIDFRSQRHNQRLATLASANGAYATIDLKSASDRLSCWVVERAFRSNSTLLTRLHACRTRWLSNDIEPSLGKYIVLKKFAAMGSACTFPVQSVIYAFVAIASVIASRGERVSSRSIDRAAHQVRIFGDDIIVPIEALSICRELLTTLGLVINDDKTVGTGKFRESCGVDAYDGHDVSVAYLLSPFSAASPGTVSTFLETSNNFFKKGYWKTAEWLASLIPHNRFLPIERVREGSLGLQSFCGSDSSHLKRRVNDYLQLDEVLCLKPVGKSSCTDTRGSYKLSQWFHEPPRVSDPFLEHLNPRVERELGIAGKGVAYWRRGWAPVRKT
jgi:hypothetical protein